MRAVLASAVALLCGVPAAMASEADLILPDLRSVKFFGDRIDGWSLLIGGLVICVFGMVFGMVQYSKIKKMKVHKSMLEISELIYGTCKTYLFTQAKPQLRTRFRIVASQLDRSIHLIGAGRTQARLPCRT